MPAASVVIVNYNYERYLRDAVDSALGQGDAVEVVVVDDGSNLVVGCGIVEAWCRDRSGKGLRHIAAGEG